MLFYYIMPRVLQQANEILSSFDVGLRQYAMKHLTKVHLYGTSCFSICLVHFVTS